MEEKQKTAYLTMNKLLFYGGTLLIYGGEVLAASLIKDLGVVFTIGAAVAGSSCQFIFPGYFYLHAELKFGAKINRRSRIIHIVMATIFIIVGFCLLFGLLAGAIINIIEGPENGSVHGAH